MITLERREVSLIATVKLNDGETIESGLRKFKKKVQRDGIVKDIKAKDAYVKPSVRRKLKTINAIKRDKKEKREKKNKR